MLAQSLKVTGAGGSGAGAGPAGGFGVGLGDGMGIFPLGLLDPLEAARRIWRGRGRPLAPPGPFQPRAFSAS